MGVLFNVQVLITSSWVRLLQSDKLCWGLGTFTWKLGDGKFIYLWWLLNNKKPIKYSANTILLWIVISFQLRSYLIPELNVVLPMIWFFKEWSNKFREYSTPTPSHPASYFQASTPLANDPNHFGLRYCQNQIHYSSLPRGSSCKIIEVILRQELRTTDMKLKMINRIV